MSVLQTVLIYVVIPAAIYALIGVLTMRRGKSTATPRYRPGSGWNYPPVWWTANPAALPSWQTQQTEQGASSGASSATGGARGRW